METMKSKDKSLSAWAEQTCAKHPEILEHMSKSLDVMDRAIAKRIMKIAGVKIND